MSHINTIIENIITIKEYESYESNSSRTLSLSKLTRHILHDYIYIYIYNFCNN
jgi:hypothetical protein